MFISVIYYVYSIDLGEIFQNTWVTIAGFLVGILGLGVGIYTMLSKPKVNPRYFIKNNNLIEEVSGMSGLSIKYKNTDIPNLSVASVLFWNKGKKTLDRSDIAPINPLKIVLDNEYQILDVQTTLTTDFATNFSYTQTDKNIITLDFDFLDKDEGFVLQIVHTGKSSLDLSIEGKIKGVESINKNTVDSGNDFNSYFINRLFGFFLGNVISKTKRLYVNIAFATMGIILIALSIIIPAIDTSEDSFVTSGGFTIVFLVYGIIFFIFLIIINRGHIPSKFSNYIYDANTNSDKSSIRD